MNYLQSGCSCLREWAKMRNWIDNFNGIHHVRTTKRANSRFSGPIVSGEFVNKCSGLPRRVQILMNIHLNGVYTHHASGPHSFVVDLLMCHVRSRSKVLLIKQILSECVRDHLNHLTAQPQQLLIQSEIRHPTQKQIPEAYLCLARLYGSDGCHCQLNFKCRRYIGAPLFIDALVHKAQVQRLFYR